MGSDSSNASNPARPPNPPPAAASPVYALCTSPSSSFPGGEHSSSLSFPIDDELHAVAGGVVTATKTAVWSMSTGIRPIRSRRPCSRGGIGSPRVATRSFGLGERGDESKFMMSVFIVAFYCSFKLTVGDGDT